jgi:hypothetical protein
MSDLRHSFLTKFEKQPKVIEDRLDKVEERLKKKLSNCFHSVRKAFL